MTSKTTNNRPILTLVFDDRPYSFGNTIDVRIDVASKGTLALRDGKIDLICKDSVLVQKRTRSNSWAYSSPPMMADIAYKTSAGRDIKKQDVERLIATVSFGGTEASNQSTNRVCRVQVKIPKEKPDDEGLIERKWWLVAKLDIAKARDVIVRKQVLIS